MKRLIAFATILSLVLSLWGCSFGRKNSEDHVTFYYCRAEYAYGTENGVIAAEDRDVTGHIGDLSYLLPLYMVGPLDEELIAPFPARTQLVSVELQKDKLLVELSDTARALADSQFTLACACLTMTCMELTNATEVVITSGERSVTMNLESLLLFDDITPSQTTPTEETQ